MKRSPLRRYTPLRSKSPRQRARAKARIARMYAKSAYRLRERAFEYMAAVKRLRCWAARTVPGHHCQGPIEADHAGRRPVGRKASDATVLPVCTLAHRQRTDHSGPFRSWTRPEMRQWLDDGIADTQRTMKALGYEVPDHHEEGGMAAVRHAAW